jgi:hypothetical protein
LALVKIYKYRIREDSQDKYLKLQEEVLGLYREHAEVDALFLHDMNDPAARTEVIQIFGANPLAALERIDSDPLILDLFERFRTEMLDPEAACIHEETLVSESPFPRS